MVAAGMQASAIGYVIAC